MHYKTIQGWLVAMKYHGLWTWRSESLANYDDGGYTVVSRWILKLSQEVPVFTHLKLVAHHLDGMKPLVKLLVVWKCHLDKPKICEKGKKEGQRSEPCSKEKNNCFFDMWSWLSFNIIDLWQPWNLTALGADSWVESWSLLIGSERKERKKANLCAIFTCYKVLPFPFL